MADVFVSYSKLDAARVTRLVTALEAHGLSVWWDTSLEQDDDFAEKIRQEIASAKCVVVCWSDQAAASKWVRAEADTADKHGKYTGVLIAEGSPPLPFNGLNYGNLVKWDGSADHPALLSLLVQVGKMTGRDDIASLAISQQKAQADEDARKKAAAEAERLRRVQEEQRLAAEAEAAKRREILRQTQLVRYVFYLFPFGVGALTWLAIVLQGGTTDSAVFFGIFTATVAAVIGWWLHANYEDRDTRLAHILPSAAMAVAALIVGATGAAYAVGEARDRDYRVKAAIQAAEEKAARIEKANAFLAGWTGRWSIQTDYFRQSNRRDRLFLDGVLTLGAGTTGDKPCRFTLREVSKQSGGSAVQTCRLRTTGDGAIEFISTVVSSTSGRWRPDNFVVNSFGEAGANGTLRLTNGTPSTVGVVFLKLPDTTLVADPAADAPTPPAPAVPTAAPVSTSPSEVVAPIIKGAQDSVAVGSLGGGAPGDRPVVSDAITKVRGSWVGAFDCGAGQTGVTLNLIVIDGEVRGEWNFYPIPEGRAVPDGAAVFSGRFDSQTRRLALRGERWIRQPAGYGLGNFAGSFDQAFQTFSVNEPSPGCRRFTLRRQ